MLHFLKLGNNVTKMLQNAYFLARIGGDTAENEQQFAEILPKIGNYPKGPAPREPPRAGAGPREPPPRGPRHGGPAPQGDGGGLPSRARGL